MNISRRPPAESSPAPSNDMIEKKNIGSSHLTRPRPSPSPVATPRLPSPSSSRRRRYPRTPSPLPQRMTASFVARPPKLIRPHPRPHASFARPRPRRPRPPSPSHAVTFALRTTARACDDGEPRRSPSQTRSSPLHSHALCKPSPSLPALPSPRTPSPSPCGRR